MKNNHPPILPDITRVLTKANIEEVIKDYKCLLDEIPLKIEAKELLELLKLLKRDSIDKGPYPHVSVFESANRIMTDLVILYGAKMILNDEINELKVNEIKVDLGNENNNDHDLIGINDSGQTLFIGEAFNVATSFFNPKKASTIKRLKESKIVDARYQIIFCNDDSHKHAGEFSIGINEITIIPIKVTL